ncbi:MAG TPA: HNH endonuclease signature motif containing protein [Bryobacteraceae bacterium]|nr:HNH endonuclease signature motif containing protein [Bryobacteraceae bacterium]
MASDISESLRRIVAERAAHRCEYCLLHEDDSYSPHQVDHIVSRKHGGRTDSDNLAYACLRCNAWKGSDIGSIDIDTGTFASLFHPRRQRWNDHFALRGVLIQPLTVEGRVTVRLLKLNLDKRVVERLLLATVGRYPRK